MALSQQRIKTPTVITIDDSVATNQTLNTQMDTKKIGNMSSRPTSASSRASDKGINSQLSSGAAFPSFAHHSAALAAAQMKHIAAMASKSPGGAGLSHNARPNSKSIHTTAPMAELYGKGSKPVTKSFQPSMALHNVRQMDKDENTVSRTGNDMSIAYGSDRILNERVRDDIKISKQTADTSRNQQSYVSHPSDTRKDVFTSGQKAKSIDEDSRRNFNVNVNSSYNEKLASKGLIPSSLGGQSQWSSSTARSMLMGIQQGDGSQSYPYTSTTLNTNVANNPSITSESYALKKPVKAKNPFTHFCRMIKPVIRAELCDGNSNVNTADLKGKIQEETQLRWRALSEEEKQVFVKKSVMDFNRYEREKQIYRAEQQKRLEMGLITKDEIDWD